MNTSCISVRLEDLWLPKMLQTPGYTTKMPSWDVSGVQRLEPIIQFTRGFTNVVESANSAGPRISQTSQRRQETATVLVKVNQDISVCAK